MKKKGGGGRINSNHSKSHRFKNPRRGPPGILLFCETGREKKCIAEGMEILTHYYNKIQNQSDDGSSDTKSKDNNKKVLSLEEEIQMIKKEKKGAPFQVYDTGCKGVVFFMCTSKHCNTIVQQPQNQLNNPETSNDISSIQVDDIDKDTSVQENIVDGKRKQIDDKIQDSLQQQKKQKTLSDNNQIPNNNDNSIIWDPITTIQTIVQDIRNNDSSAPRSRFVTKMIPIQATCFANTQEIAEAVRLLLKRFLMPYGIQFAKTKMNDFKRNQKTIPTFKIEFRRRFCSHMKREDVISIVANAVEALTNDYWNATSTFAAHVQQEDNKRAEGKEKTVPPLFGVDLGNPDFTIIIEICRTLCTMAVVEDAQSYHHFNLMKIQENAENNERKEKI